MPATVLIIDDEPSILTTIADVLGDQGYQTLSAESAGIQQGDVILEFDGRPVTEMRKLPRMVAETGIGKAVDVVVWRKGKTVNVKVQLGELKDEQIAAATTGPSGQSTGEVRALGLELATVTPDLRDRFELDERAEGVVVTDVDPESSGAEKGLRPGDVIVEVDQEPVKNPGEVAERVAKAEDEGYRVVTLLVLRQGDYEWVAVKIGEDKP